MESPPVLLILIISAIATEDVTGASGGKPFKNEQNIGTVLFERSDCGKHCWTSEEFTVLNSRRMFQDVLPKTKVIDCQNDRYVALLMDYFHVCLESVRKLSVGKTKHLMLKALADTMGGYLRVYVLPLTRHSYYAGNVRYKNAKRLFELFDELKTFLRTNGLGWMKPVQDLKGVKTPPILITPPQTSLACNGLVTYPIAPTDAGHVDASTGKQRRSHSSQRRSSRDAASAESQAANGASVVVPLPFLDDDSEPNSIAMPFRTNNLQSLYCAKSAFALVKYYVASVKCLLAESRGGAELVRFNEDLFDWLHLTVYPRLDDEKWYPAFGGVLRVIASLKETGLGRPDGKGKQAGDYQVMPNAHGPTKAPSDREQASPLYEGKTQAEDASESGLTFGTTELVVVALAGALLVWLLVGLILACYRFLGRQNEDRSPRESASNTSVAVLYENSEYRAPDSLSNIGSPSKSSRKNLGRRFGGWWRDKFSSCPGGCRDHEDEERCLAAISYSSKDTVDDVKDVSTGRKCSASSVTKKRRRSSKMALASRSMVRAECGPTRKVCYSTDETTSHCGEDSPKPR